MSETDRQAYDALRVYTLRNTGREFLHQQVVDAYAAQMATDKDKPIRLVFALIGLYLHVERGLSGRDVQLAHMALAQKRKDWPRLEAPEDRGAIRAADVAAAPEGPTRDAMIKAWARAVWAAYAPSHGAEIRELLRTELEGPRQA